MGRLRGLWSEKTRVFVSVGLWQDKTYDQQSIDSTNQPILYTTLFPFIARKKMSEDLHPSLRNIVEQESLNWIFVGGKGKVSNFTCISNLD